MLLFENYVRFGATRRPVEGPQFSVYAKTSLIPVVFYTDSAANSSGSTLFPDAPNVTIYSTNPLTARIGGRVSGFQEKTNRGELPARYASVGGDGRSD